MNQSAWRAALVRLAITGLTMVGLVGIWPRAELAGAAPIAGQASGFPPNTFVPTGAMNVRRSGATATLLSDGNVLVAGGGTASAELYHPKAGTWTATGSMSAPRSSATATLLPDGDVLVAGGCCEPANPYRGLSTVELYHPGTGTWSLTGSLNSARYGHTASLLGNGEVLVAGGACNGSNYGCDAGSFLVNQRSAELYSPSTGAWTKTGSMRFGRAFHTATVLQNGEVLVTGGLNSCDDDFCSDLSSAERYDPATGQWLTAGSMHVGRERHTATLLGNGEVLVAGGLNEGGYCCGAASLASAELYNPLYGRWQSAAPMNHVRYGQTATTLEGGWVLVTGGATTPYGGAGTSTSEVYQPTPGIWVPTGSLSTPRMDQTATLLGDGDVLVAGGSASNREPLSTAEVYHAGAGPLVRLSTTQMTFGGQWVGTTGNGVAFTATNDGTAPLHVAGVQVAGSDPSDFTATTGCSPQPLAPGASCSVLVRFSPLVPGPRTATVGLVDDAPLSPQSVAVGGTGAGPYVWAPTGSMSTPRVNFSATLLGDGKVLVAGGEEFYGQTAATAELYDPVTGSFTPTGSLVTSREFGASARLPDGRVLVAGGYTQGPTGTGLLSSAELYNPKTGTWSSTAPMLVASDGITATTLPNGKVLVTGFTASNPELYDPATASWSTTGPLPVANGYYSLAVLLHDGTVLLTAGPNGASALYDPATDSWSASGSEHQARNGGTITVLANGEVLVAGGGDSNGNVLTEAELYNPAQRTWATTGALPTSRFAASSVLLPNGQVLLTGGCSISCRNSGADEETYLYSNGFWSPTGSLPQTRNGQSLVLLPDGAVLLAGGAENGSADATPTAELYVTPLVAANPSTVAAGQQVTLAGSGFYAHEVVIVSVQGPTYRNIAQATTDSRGRFQTTITVPKLPAGTYQLQAQGQISFATALGSLVVTKT